MATFGSQSLFNKPPALTGFGTPAPATASPFGAPAAGGLFGSTTPAFGSPAPTQQAAAFGSSTFGQTQAAPAFGQQQQPGGAFSFASTPGFGAAAPAQQQQQASPSPFGNFGAVNTPSPFGQQQAGGTSLFGTPNPAPAAGASPFGGGLFGSSQSAAATAGGTTPSLFGNAFGTAQQTTAAPFSFAPASGATNMFGAGQQQQQQQQQVLPGAYGAAAAPDTAVKEIMELRNAYVSSSPTFKFNHLFLSVVDDPRQRVKPPQVDEMRWRQALAQAGGPDNPDRLWPVLATGFRDLRLRAQAQQTAIQENSTQLQRMSDQAHQLGRRHELELRQRSAAVQRRHQELAQRLLHCCRCVDALEARLAVHLGYPGDLSRAKEQDVSRTLSAVEAELGPGGSGLQRRLESVASAARLRLGAPGEAKGSQAKLDDSSAAQLFSVLQEHAVAAKHLQAVLRRDQLDVDIMAQARLEAGMAA